MKNSNLYKKKKILLINKFFLPDRSSCSSILFHIAKNFSDNNFQVDVITGMPKRYNIKFSKKQLSEFDKKSSLKIKRISLLREGKSSIKRIINSLLLSIFGILEFFKKNHEIVIVTTCPPILTAFIFCSICNIFKKKFIYYCMDINPEIGIVSGDYKNKFLSYLMLSIDNWTCRHSYTVIVHSNSMRKSLLDRNNSKNIKIKKINSFAVVDKANVLRDFKSTRFNYLFSKDSLNIIYAGNFGRFQGLEHVIKGFSLIKDQNNIRLILLGDGEEKEKLKNLSKSLKANVFFIDNVSQEESKKIIKKADLGLISLIPNVHKYAYPSKLMSYLEQGLPIIGLIEKNSDLAKDIEKNKIGFVVPLYDHIHLRDLLIDLQKNLYWKKIFRKQSLLTFKEKFSSNIMLKKWDTII